ncbi:MAG TPA: heat-inducible transcription repressor HrcA [Bacteroidetes bacterium]|nr:heat-inducible transcription repressor HrcA [Bacteroidota bacterium]HRK04000.1 heat-inducible transcriptional repressor HrcA [Chlorobiota bacterium]
MKVFKSPEDLNERERTILRAIVHLFILHATPVGSRVVSRYLERELPLSPATIRNVMSDLEDAGFIMHPHTSAGRMPTDLGYRVYVDYLMKMELLPSRETETVVNSLMDTPKESVIREASKMLGSLSHHLALVELPQLRDAVVERVEILRLSSDKLLVVIALESDVVRTVSLEWDGNLTDVRLDEITRLINERLAGRTLSQLPLLFPDSTSDDASAARSLIRLFVEHVGKLATTSDSSSIHLAGRQNLLQLPEFEDPARMRSVIELIENEEVIVHVLGSTRDEPGVTVKIGNEIDHDVFSDYSLVATTFRSGSMSGSVGLIGPKRMDYNRMINLVNVVSGVLSRKL